MVTKDTLEDQIFGYWPQPLHFEELFEMHRFKRNSMNFIIESSLGNPPKRKHPAVAAAAAVGRGERRRKRYQSLQA
jgi:hypothetical protein